MAETRRGRGADSRRDYQRLRHIYGSWLDGGRRLYVYSDKSDIVVLVVEGYEDCTKSLALVKKFFDAKVVTVLNKHERGIEYPGAALKIPFSATLDYYNRRGQLYTEPG